MNKEKSWPRWPQNLQREFKMVQIYQDEPSFASRLLTGGQQVAGEFGKAFLGEKLAHRQGKAEAEAFKKLTGTDLSGLPPEARSEFLKEFAKSEAKQQMLKKLFPENQQSSGDFQSLMLGNTTQENKQENPFLNLTPEQRLKLNLVDPRLGEAAFKEEQLKEKKQEAKASRHYDISKEILKSTAARAETLPQKEMALQNMNDAIQNGNLGFFSKDNLAEITGIEGFRSPQGAVFKTAGKEFFLGSLQRAGARPNQWIEQQISDMLTKIGRSTEANLSVTEALKTELEVEKKQIELTNQLADQLENQLGYIPRDLSAQVQKLMTPYAQEKQKELKERLMEIKADYTPNNKNGHLMRHPDGSFRRVQKNDLKKALKAGYKLEK